MSEINHQPDSDTAHASGAEMESIAQRTHADVNTVKLVFEEEFTAVAREARLTQFIKLLAHRRAMSRLRAREQQ